MAAFPSATKWIPEDDLLLRNALEAGASLEALAKGAVSFSGTYTVKELRDRWHALLYDPVVSAEASTRMIESEHSAKKSGNENKNSEFSIKRKFESVRNLYYSMQKRLCREINKLQLSEPDSYLMDRNAFSENDPNGYLRNECSRLSERVQSHSGKQMLRSDYKMFFRKNDGVEFRDCPGNSEMDPSHGLQDCSASYEVMGFTASLLENLQDIRVPEVPPNINQDLKEAILHHDSADGANVNSSSYDSQDMKEILPDDHENADAEVGVPVLLETDFADLSDCLLNLGNEDDPLANDVDVKDTEDAGKDASDLPSGVGSTSYVLTCCDEKLHDTVPTPGDVDESTCYANKSVLLPEKNDVVSNQLDLGNYNHLLVSGQVDDQSFANDLKSCSPTDTCDEFSICTLNTEDPEIPVNSAFPSPTVSVSSHKCSSGSSCLQLPSLNKDKQCQLLTVGIKQNTLETSKAHSWKDPQARPDGDPNFLVPPGGLKIEVSDAQFLGSKKETISPNADILQHRKVGGTKDCTLETNSVDVCTAEGCSIDVEENLSGCHAPDSEGIPPGIDLENESDPLVPSFADIEAMILNMELCPKDWDSSSSEVSRYQKEDARRAIIRLEQCAQSSIRRSIRYRGALAILYGRQSRHYIHKAEVLLGRSTDGFEVDIDLGTEGGSNQISRRQALIKLERDASFSLKNLGKSSMFLNGKEVSSRKCVRLHSSCLLEVKGIAFVFETDERSVQKYLGSQKETSSFKWSPEGIEIK